LSSTAPKGPLFRGAVREKAYPVMLTLTQPLFFVILDFDLARCRFSASMERPLKDEEHITLQSEQRSAGDECE